MRRSFGAFSAVPVALLTEMYGFPLTLYFLSGWLQTWYPVVEWFSHDPGHLLEMLFGWRANPHFGPFHVLSVVFIGAGFLVIAAGWRVLYASQRAGVLATEGPYGYVRHPRKVGFVLVMFGFLLQWPALLTLAMLPVLVWMYARPCQPQQHGAASKRHLRSMEIPPRSGHRPGRWRKGAASIRRWRTCWLTRSRSGSAACCIWTPCASVPAT